MTEATAYPVAQPTPLGYPGTQQAEVDPKALPPAEQAQVDALYEELKPIAVHTARDYVLARTKPEWQVEMTAKIDADWPVPEPPPPAPPARAIAPPHSTGSGQAHIPADPPVGYIAEPRV
jgi:hypothetical protein